MVRGIYRRLDAHPGKMPPIQRNSVTERSIEAPRTRRRSRLRIPAARVFASMSAIAAAVPERF